jgi:hypothetical protein
MKSFILPKNPPLPVVHTINGSKIPIILCQAQTPNSPFTLCSFSCMRMMHVGPKAVAINWCGMIQALTGLRGGELTAHGIPDARGQHAHHLPACHSAHRWRRYQERHHDSDHRGILLFLIFVSCH